MSVTGPLRKIMASAATVGLAVTPLAGNAIAEDPSNATVRTVSATDAQNVNFGQAARNFIIRYNPNAESFSPSLLRDTVSDIHRAGCEKVELDDSRRYGSFYNLKAPWYEGGRNFTVDDVGTAGTIAINLCLGGSPGGSPGSGPA